MAIKLEELDDIPVVDRSTDREASKFWKGKRIDHFVFRTWDRMRRTGYDGNQIEEAILGMYPWDGGATAEKIFNSASETRASCYETELQRIFYFFDEHLKNTNIFNDHNVTSAINYYEAHQSPDWDETTLYANLDPKQPLQTFFNSKNYSNIVPESRFPAVAKHLKDLPSGGFENMRLMHANLATGIEDITKKGRCNNTTMPPVCTIPFLWILSLFGKSFKGTYENDAPTPRINPRPETAVIDTLWNLHRAALSEKVPKFVDSTDNDAHRDFTIPLTKVALYAWGGIFKRIGAGKYFSGNADVYNNPNRGEFLRKLKRVAHYASVSKSLFCLLERELERCYLDPLGAEKIYPFVTDIEQILDYPNFLKTIPEGERTQAEKTLARYLEPKKGITAVPPEYEKGKVLWRVQEGETNPIRKYLTWYREKVIFPKYRDISRATYNYIDANFNALSVETAYDSDFYIPKEGENHFVSYIMRRFLSRVDSGSFVSKYGKQNGFKVIVEKNGEEFIGHDFRELFPLQNSRLRAYHLYRQLEKEGYSR